MVLRCRSLLGASLALVLAGSASAPAPDTTARWAPAEGECAAWRWTITHDLELEALSLGPEDSEAVLAVQSGIGLRVRDTLELVAEDRLLERDADGPCRSERELARARRKTQADLTGWGRMRAEGPDEIETVSRLEGARLTFDWNERAGEILADFAADQDGDPDLLDGLEEEVDLRGLLGGRARKPGEAWYPDEDALRRLLHPGGELAFVAPEPDFLHEHEEAALGWLLSAAYVGGDLGAWGRAEYERVVTDEGRRQACIRLRLDYELRGDVRDRLVELVETLGSGDTWLDLTRAIRVQIDLRLDGHLYWDLEAQRAASLDLHGHADARLALQLDLPGVYGGPDWRLDAKLRGTTEVRVEAAACDAR